ncbi:hypothetical protein C427_0573 [Paraglaciecola psychrophila 170]|uniref:Uncharacterized protein n=1 Tax=Paraglaciecola psychrophila 170 TaxID=1129794 RepID=M4RJC5_9ALTE|nr:hypothetical protein C427_0573 [Paraglaciecola psychrophila 170]
MHKPGTKACIKQAIAALKSFIEKLIAVKKCCMYVSLTDFGWSINNCLNMSISYFRVLLAQ